MLVRHLYSAFIAVCFFSCNVPLPVWAGEEPTREELQSLIEAAEGRIADVDQRLDALDQERNQLQGEARKAHREQFEVRQRVMEEDEAIQQLVARLETLQLESRQVQEELAGLMSEHPDYVEQRTIQGQGMERARAIRREELELANVRVAIQQKLFALRRELADLMEEGEPDAAPEDATPPVEDL